MPAAMSKQVVPSTIYPSEQALNQWAENYRPAKVLVCNGQPTADAPPEVKALPLTPPHRVRQLLALEARYFRQRPPGKRLGITTAKEKQFWEGI